MKAYKLYDEQEEQYVDGIETFDAIQEYLAEEWEDDLYPATDMYAELHAEIYAAESVEKLQVYADGLGYTIEEVNE